MTDGREQRLCAWRFLLGVIWLAWMTSLAGVPVSAAHAEPNETRAVGWMDPTPRIAVISAFAPELALLRQALEAPREHRVNGVAFTTGVLQGHPVVIFLSGMSMVNAAMTTQLAIDRFPVTHILFSGIAGGVSPDLNIGDVSVPERWGQHLEVLMARELAPGVYGGSPDAEGLDLPGFGMLHHRGVRVVTQAQPEPPLQFWFPVDPALLRAARALGDVTLHACDDKGVCLRESPRLVVGGHGVSGSAFVDNARYREHLARVFDAHVVDMESAASAVVAHANQVPFLAFRSVSDLAGGGHSTNEMMTFLSLAAGNSARVLMAFLARWPEAATLQTLGAGDHQRPDEQFSARRRGVRTGQ